MSRRHPTHLNQNTIGTPPAQKSSAISRLRRLSEELDNIEPHQMHTPPHALIKRIQTVAEDSPTSVTTTQPNKDEVTALLTVHKHWQELHHLYADLDPRRPDRQAIDHLLHPHNLNVDRLECLQNYATQLRNRINYQHAISSLQRAIHSNHDSHSPFKRTAKRLLVTIQHADRQHNETLATLTQLASSASALISPPINAHAIKQFTKAVQAIHHKYDRSALMARLFFLTLATGMAAAFFTNTRHYLYADKQSNASLSTWTPISFVFMLVGTMGSTLLSHRTLLHQKAVDLAQHANKLYKSRRSTTDIFLSQYSNSYLLEQCKLGNRSLALPPALQRRGKISIPVVTLLKQRHVNLSAIYHAQMVTNMTSAGLLNILGAGQNHISMRTQSQNKHWKNKLRFFPLKILIARSQHTDSTHLEDITNKMLQRGDSPQTIREILQQHGLPDRQINAALSQLNDASRAEMR